MGNQESAYNETLKERGFENEVQRLKYQAEIFWNKEKDFFKLIGVSSNSERKILEVGSGPGYITELIKKSFPGNSITCLELNENLIRQARNNKNLEDIEIIKGSILESNLPSESFDIIYTRLVLMHIPQSESEKAIQEIYRLLKPGGYSIISEAEDSFILISPEVQPKELFNKISQIANELQKQHGGDRSIGRKTPKLLKKHGFTNIKVNYPIVHTDIDSVELIKSMTKPENYKPFLDNGLLTEEEFQTLEKLYNEFPQSDDQLAMSGVLIITAKK